MSDSPSDDRVNFVRAAGEVMKAIAIAYQRNEKIEPDVYVAAAKEAFDEFFNSMKGAVDIQEKDVENGVLAEIDREDRFYKEISEFSRKFKQQGLLFRIESITSGSTPGMYRDTCWNTGIAPQCDIRIGPMRNYIVAFPTGPAMAGTLYSLEQDQLPAAVMYASPSVVFLLPYGEDLDAATWTIFKKIFGDVKTFQISVSGVLNARVGSGFLSIDSEQTFSGKELDTMFKEYNVHIVVTVNPRENRSTLHVKTEHDLSTGPMKLHYWAFNVVYNRAKGW
nr:hypothetical protein [Candidatus Sigynarchaeota archaeon]